jgi:hypothetical protein
MGNSRDEYTTMEAILSDCGPLRICTNMFVLKRRFSSFRDGEEEEIINSFTA